VGRRICGLGRRQKDLIVSFSEMIGGNPTLSDDFNFSGPHPVTATTWEKPGSENQVPVTVDLADTIGENQIAVRWCRNLRMIGLLRGRRSVRLLERSSAIVLQPRPPWQTACPESPRSGYRYVHVLRRLNCRA
jgi:hypothetical protein